MRLEYDWSEIPSHLNFRQFDWLKTETLGQTCNL